MCVSVASLHYLFGFNFFSLGTTFLITLFLGEQSGILD